ncbi:hypothetical protein L907_07095 [Agrobacterium sp. C13]|nr:hypothetical protein L904_07125 [Agrobacterium sp. LY4]KVK47920.1 hypothetical protein L903_07135 [Agrobacterium sp. JL28]KVK60693.1 hypothetical protein L906_07095 [Agrobacterium sp. TS45]KVK66011.1 hypothetical protein L907_07095 [Agrobacterium sp. C13]
MGWHCFANGSAVPERLADAGAEIGILQRRYRRHGFGAAGKPVLIADRNIELAEGEIPAGAFDDIVKMVGTLTAVLASSPPKISCTTSAVTLPWPLAGFSRDQRPLVSPDQLFFRA